ncbi:MAG TPA: translocation/assembly module TamB domain-containing protein [Terriglobales bacterium]
MSLGSKLAGFGRYCLMALLLLMLLVSAALWYVTTDSFQQMVRGRLIAALERATGGRVELGSFHAIPLRFQVEVRNLTIHGREAASERPLAHVDSMSAVINISSALGARIAFHSLTLDGPVVHVIFYPDGSTNQPAPKQQGTADLAQLFATSIDRLEVRHGELLLQDQRLPLEFVSNDVSVRLNYSFLHRRYSGDAAIGKAETQFGGYRPVAWAGQAIFSIDSSGVQIHSITAASESSKFQASGTILDFRNPVFKGSYDFLLNLQQAGAVLRDPRMRSGTLELRGTGSWSSKTFAADGTFDLRDAGWQDQRINVKNSSASGKFVVDPLKIELAHVQGQLLHGSFASDAEILNWQASEKRAAKAKPEQRGTIRIQAKDMSVAELLASFGPRYHSVRTLRFAGDLSGTSEIHWRESIRNGEVGVAVRVSAPKRLTPGQTALTASVRANYHMRSSSLEIADLTANTAATQIAASGALAESATRLRFSFTSSDLREWRPLMSDFSSSRIPGDVRGRGAFNGTATGSFENLMIAGKLQLQDFDARLPQNSTAEIVHVDSLGAEIQFSSRSLNVREGTVHSGDTTLKVDGSIGLTDWNVTDESGVRLRLDLEDVEVSELAAQLATDLTFTGKINAHLEIGGTKATPQGQGGVTWENGSVQGYAFDSAAAGITMHGKQAGFNNLQITRRQSRITGHGTYDLSAKTFQVSIAGSNFDVAEFTPLQRSRMKLGGALDFTADISGTKVRPDVNAHLHLRELTFNQELAGDYWLDAVTHGQDVHLSGHSNFKTAQLTIDGDVHLRDQWPAKIGLHFTRLDVDPLIESYLHSHITRHSSVGGELLLEGPLRDPLQLTVTGNLSQLNAEVQRVQLRNEGPLQFAVSRETLRISALRVIGANTDFSVNGSIQLSGERKLDLNGNGEIGLQIIQTYDPDLTGSGKVKVEANLTGSLGSPLVRGKLQIENASLADVNLPSALSGLNGTLAFSQNRVTIDNLTAQTGGGNVSFSGHAELAGGQVNFDLTAKGDSVRLRYPPGVSSTATTTLHWSGSTAGSLLSGDVTVMKLGVTPGFDFGAYLQKEVQQSSLPQTDPVLNKIRLDLHVVTTPELQMQTNVVRLRGEADLRVRGNAGKPVLLGRADIFEGEAYFNGTKYRLERGGVTFGTPAANNPAGTVPYVDFEATTRVKDYDITLSINGPADRPKLNYRSEPPLPTNDIIGLLAFGGTSEESAQLQQNSQSAFSQQASNAMLAAALNATLNNRAQRLFGNSRIKIDPQGLETETSPTQNGPAVTIEQQVKDNLTVTYTTNVSQTSQQIIRAEYNISRNVSIVAIRDQNGVVSFDVKIRRRKR